nr:MAG TPA: hypothetical protein [Caudoviricetes sp.]
MVWFITKKCTNFSNKLVLYVILFFYQVNSLNIVVTQIVVFQTLLEHYYILLFLTLYNSHHGHHVVIFNFV